MSRKPNQNVRVARALRAAGTRGVDTLTLRREHRIGNPGQRILELKARGFRFEGTDVHGDDTRVKVWRMTHDAGDVAAALTDRQLLEGAGASPVPGKGAEAPGQEGRRGARSGDRKEVLGDRIAGPEEGPSQHLISLDRAEPAEACADAGSAQLFESNDYRRAPRHYGSEEDAAA